MNLNSIGIEIRNRTNWEAFDLGKPLLMEYKKEVYLPWFTVNFILFALIYSVCYQNPVLALFLMWLLLPLSERIVLFVLSRAVFGEAPTYKETLKQWLPQLKNGIFSYNCAWRFLANRSLFLAIWQLEGLKGSQRRKRLDQIGHKASQTAFMEGAIFATIEQLLAFSMVALALFFVPEGLILWDEIFADSLSDNMPVWLFWLSSAVYWIVVILIRPIYVAGGFTLYLHRRMVLEGWDIELQFRSLAERLKLKSILVISGMFFLFSPLPANAEEAPRQMIEEIMADEEFETKKEITTRVFKNPGEEKDYDFSFLSGLAGFFKIIFILLIIFLVVWLIYRIISSTKIDFKKEKGSKIPAVKIKELMGLDLSEDSLPTDIHQEVSKLIQAEKYREALSLLYRATLFDFVNNNKVSLKKSYTENDCLDAVRQQVETGHKTYFEKLTIAWINLAYGHTPPLVEQLITFNMEWQQLFAVNSDDEGLS
jgi:hypothetical protein